MVWSIWQHVVEQRRAYVHDDHARSAFECDVGDARVLVERSSASVIDPEAHVMARFPVPAGPAFSVRSKRLLDGLSPLLGKPTIDFDHSFFDELFTVQTDQPDATRAVWTTAAIEQMCLCRDGRVDSDGHTVTLRHHGLVLDPQLINTAIDVVAAIVSADIFGYGALRDLPGALYRPPTGTWDNRTEPWIELHVPTRVDLAPLVKQGRVRTWAARPFDEIEPFSVRIDSDRAFADAEDRIPSPLQRYLTQMGTGVLVASEGALTFTWRGIETARPRLIAAARLLAGFPNVQSFGAFR